MAGEVAQHEERMGEWGSGLWSERQRKIEEEFGLGLQRAV